MSNPLITSSVIEAILEDNNQTSHARDDYQNGTTSKEDAIEKCIQFLLDFRLNAIPRSRESIETINRFISK